jgi:Mg-chelatase subunit ChlD
MGKQWTEVCEFVAERFERQLVLIISDGETERWIARNIKESLPCIIHLANMRRQEFLIIY